MHDSFRCIKPRQQNLLEKERSGKDENAAPLRRCADLVHLWLPSLFWSHRHSDPLVPPRPLASVEAITRPCMSSQRWSRTGRAPWTGGFISVILGQKRIPKQHMFGLFRTSCVNDFGNQWMCWEETYHGPCDGSTKPPPNHNLSPGSWSQKSLGPGVCLGLASDFDGLRGTVPLNLSTAQQRRSQTCGSLHWSCGLQAIQNGSVLGQGSFFPKALNIKRNTFFRPIEASLFKDGSI